MLQSNVRHVQLQSLNADSSVGMEGDIDDHIGYCDDNICMEAALNGDVIIILGCRKMWVV